MIYILGTLIAMSMAYMAKRLGYCGATAKQKCLAAHLFAFLAVIPLLLISAVRYGVGSDYFSYVNFYQEGSTRFEWAIQIITVILRKISRDSQIFFAATSIIFCSVYFYVIFKESANPVYSILLFVLTEEYFRSMNGIRQAISMAIALCSLYYFKEKKILGTTFFIALACLFHKSAISFLLLYAIYFICPPPLLVVFATGSIVFWGKYVISFLFPIIDRFTTWGHYFSYSKDFGETVFLTYVGIFALLWLLYKRVKNNKNMRLLYSAITYGLVVIVSGVFVASVVVGRAVWCVQPFIILYIPETIRQFPKKRDQYLVNMIIILCYAALLGLAVVLKGDQGVLPYATFWQ